MALVDEQKRILANCIRSQTKAHAAYGGVVPEIAARNHIAWMQPILEEALAEAETNLSAVDAIAVTAGPGLIGGVIVGLMTAKTLASVYDMPLIGINHLEGHALTVRLTDAVEYPYLLLLISGGHCQFVLVRGLGDYETLGGTIDDALGETFDKCAKMMGIAYPGGPEIERLARSGNPTRFDLPKPLCGQKRIDFSFSGLKTAIRYKLQDLPELTDTLRADMAASFQHTVIAILEEKISLALAHAKTVLGVMPPLVLAGGVAANQAIRSAMEDRALALGSRCIVPPPRLCTDNAVMIAWAGMERYRAGDASPLTIEPRARWPLSEVGLGVAGAAASPRGSNPY